MTKLSIPDSSCDAHVPMKEEPCAQNPPLSSLLASCVESHRGEGEIKLISRDRTNLAVVMDFEVTVLFTATLVIIITRLIVL